MERLELPAAGDLHVWRGRLDVGDAAVADRCLSADELARARRLVRPLHARRFVIARALLRRLLAAYLDTDPAEFSFSYDEHGKPRLAGTHASSLSFNVAHSADAALFAFAAGERRLGVDVELLRDDLRMLDIARHHFAADEVAAVEAAEPAERAATFFRCWTRKEAYLKARGVGLSAPLDGFVVSIAPDAPPALLWHRDGVSEIAAWHLVAPPPPPGFAAAIAIDRRPGEPPPRCVVRDISLEP